MRRLRYRQATGEPSAGLARIVLVCEKERNSLTNNAGKFSWFDSQSKCLRCGLFVENLVSSPESQKEVKPSQRESETELQAVFQSDHRMASISVHFGPLHRSIRTRPQCPSAYIACITYCGYHSLVNTFQNPLNSLKFGNYSNFILNTSTVH